MATSSTESSVSCDQKPHEPANDIRHPRWPLWPDTPPDFGLKLPELKGEDDFESWDLRVLGILRIHGLKGFVTGTEIPPPSDTPEDFQDLQTFNDRRRCAYRSIYYSTKPIHSELYLSGYNTNELPDDLDPKALWDAIHRWDLISHLHISAKVDLVRELSHIHHSQFDNLLEFKRRAEWLRCRLERAGVTIKRRADEDICFERVEELSRRMVDNVLVHGGIGLDLPHLVV
ncbi:hypothetical protein QR685DRAFT_91469 [Neurospora intermedia]|uniref:Uncharacterized protein n=1 Tax=Neurospora intermedia TaxID=5142 RepID=A0ABR3D2F9_NEUIN